MYLRYSLGSSSASVRRRGGGVVIRVNPRVDFRIVPAIGSDGFFGLIYLLQMDSLLPEGGGGATGWSKQN